MSHEALVRLVHDAPSMIPRLVWPDRRESASIRVGPAEITDLHLAEHRADAVLLVGDDAHRPARAIIVEVQCDVDRDKEWTWPLYLAGVRARLRCPTVLVVIAVDPAVARWARRGIDLGDGGCTLRPFVVGAADIPVITDAAVARAAPELAILSVAAHAAGPAGEGVVEAAIDATRGLDRDRSFLYFDFVLAYLKKAAPALLEKIMIHARYEYQSDFARKYFAEGEVKGVARALVTVLEQRGFAVGEAERRRILECDDLERLQSWLGRVLTACSLAEVLDG